MKEEMIFFDVDGTLRDNNNHKVSLTTQLALQQLKENGYLLGIATGRSVDSLQRTGIMELIEWDGYVCNNGQTILNKEKKYIQNIFLDPTVVKQCIAIAKELNMPLALKCNPRIVTQTPDKNMIKALQYFKSPIPKVDTYQGQKVSAMIAYAPVGYDYAPFKVLSGVEVLPGEATYCDITIAGVSKATSIMTLMKTLDCQKYIAFGDSLNDIEMFKHATFSIAMKQGNAYAKQIADYVTTSIYEDGIYQACKVLKYI